MKTKTNRDLRCISSRKAELYMDKPFFKRKIYDEINVKTKVPKKPKLA